MSCDRVMKEWSRLGAQVQVNKNKKKVIYKKHAEYAEHTEYVPCCNQSSHKAMYTEHAEGKKVIYTEHAEESYAANGSYLLL